MTEVLIVGSPNCGKTTLFNALTGKNERVGNWYGVTTRAVSGVASIGKVKYMLTDLPGSYLDGSYTLEGSNLKGKLKSDCKVLFLMQASDFLNSIKLLKKVLLVTSNVCVVINMYGEFKSAGGYIDVSSLKQLTGFNVILAECNTKSGVSAVNRLIGILLSEDKPKNFNFDLDGLKKCYHQSQGANLDKFDLFLLKSPLFYPFLALMLLAVLYLAFGKYGLGSGLQYLLEFMFESCVNRPIGALLSNFCTPFLCGFVLEGVLGGFLAVLTFLPRLAIISIFLTALEQSGLFSRIAFRLNQAFQGVGLSGRAIFSLFSGFGCTAIAVSTTNGLENNSIKKRAVYGMPYLSCTAKTPIYLFILSHFSLKLGFWFLLLVYLGGLALYFASSFVLFKLSGEKEQDLIIEFPPKRVPSAKILLKALQKFAKEFIIKIGIIVSVCTMAIYLMRSVSLNFTYLPKELASQSILYFLSQRLSFIFAPIGVSDPCFTLSVICGLFAKEGIVACLTLFNFSALSIRQALAFLTFCYFYPPCVTAMASISNEVGKKGALFIFVKHLLLALLCCYAVVKPIYLLLLAPFIALNVIFIKRKGNYAVKSQCTNCKFCKWKRF